MCHFTKALFSNHSHFACYRVWALALAVYAVSSISLVNPKITNIDANGRSDKEKTNSIASICVDYNRSALVCGPLLLLYSKMSTRRAVVLFEPFYYCYSDFHKSIQEYMLVYSLALLYAPWIRTMPLMSHTMMAENGTLQYMISCIQYRREPISSVFLSSEQNKLHVRCGSHSKMDR